MNNRTLQLLGFVVVILIAALLLVESGDDGDAPDAGNLLFPDMEAVANDIDRLTVSRAGAETVAIARKDGQWGVETRKDYPAKVGAVQNVLLAMVDARVVESKTADPDLHDRLGVDTLDHDNSKGVLVNASTGDSGFSLILGNVSQGSYRYARIADEDQSWLIDQNPEIPATAGEWLAADIVDIDASRVSSVIITHSDGEVIGISKTSADAPNFDVADTPEGRELSYSTVANGIGGALNDLDLDDVRPAISTDEPAVETVFHTFDDVKIVAKTVKVNGENWLSLTVDAEDSETGEITELRTRIDGWQFRIADYKANLLTRRWDDILKPDVPEQ